MNTVLAQFGALIDKGKINYTGPTSDANVITGLLNAVYFWAGLIAVGVIVVAGFYYVSSSGDAQKIVRAKNAILYSVIGLVVILSAFVITNTVLGGVKR